ncbi:MAG: hypothetical protein MRZ65_11310 [Lachnospiraceae bacterium]|nr:hypothetical protein [Lachnospiraceae bacterium]
MGNTSSAFIGSESAEIKKNNRRPALSRAMYAMRNTKLASFDIFDTLLLRPFSDPKDLFYILGEKFNEMDFYNLRIRCEKEARDIKEELYGNREIDIYDIYRRIQYYTGIDVEYGVNTEFETEMDLIYPNDYQKYIFNTFINNRVPVVLTSDMYYPAEMIEVLLRNNGFTGYEKIYVSCDKECAKSDGTLFDCVAMDYEEIPLNLITHIDDNWNVIVKAREKGINTVHYARNTSLTNKYRPKYMSAMVGSAYRGIIGNYLASDESTYSVPYEYGFTYGGFLILGYCSYIHEICVEEKIEKVFFMSRDGDIIKQVWDYMYNDIPSEYLLISRACVMRLSADVWKKMFIENAVDRMSTRRNKKNVGQILDYCELTDLKDDLQQYGLTTDMIVSQSENSSVVSLFRDFMENHLDKIRDKYKESNTIYENYLERLISSVDSRLALVDIGWRGVNGTTLSKVIKKLRPEISTTNFIVGGRQPVNLPQIRNGDIRCYMFSAEKNYGALENHKEKTNFYYELLTMSATSSFQYFYHDRSGRVRMKCSSVTPADYDKIKEIQRGILDFVKEYTFRFRKYPSFYKISADDVAQVLYNVMSKDEYFTKYFSDLNYSPELGNEDKSKFGEWI